MAAPHIDVRHVARLARLELSDEEVRVFEGQLDAILAHVQQLSELDVEGIEPTAHPAPVFDRTDADEPGPGLERELVLRNAPDQSGGQFRVPKVVADA
jgi:aspartyl-tRNA(Asn)/glutamyl-tRNA(Gln) amidotransferase subunit C